MKDKILGKAEELRDEIKKYAKHESKEKDNDEQTGRFSNDNGNMSPTILRKKGYRFFFFSREEARKHVHIYSENGEAKFWLEPHLELAMNYGFPRKEIKEIEDLISILKKDGIISIMTHFHRELNNDFDFEIKRPPAWADSSSR